MFHIINDFESLMSEFYGSPYAVAVDCATHAIELCFRLQSIKKSGCPKHTYLSVPMTMTKINISYEWTDELWKDYYFLSGTNIIDAAVYWKENSYISGTMMCLSFQYRKHLSLGRGGMILLDDKKDYETLIKMSYDGRTRDLPWAEQQVDTMGYHYYMTPEMAQMGIDKFPEAKIRKPVPWSYLDFPDLSLMPVFRKEKEC